MAPGVQGFERKRNVRVPPNTGASTVRPCTQRIKVLTEWPSGLLVVFYQGTDFRSTLACLRARAVHAWLDTDMTNVTAGEVPECSPSIKRLCRSLRGHEAHIGSCQGRSFNVHVPTKPRNETEMLEVLGALGASLRVEILYIYNCGAFMGTQSVTSALVGLLRQGRIWAVNIGETDWSAEQWWEFVDNLQHTNVAYLYISEGPAKLTRDGVTLKTAARNAIRVNRHVYGMRDQLGMSYVARMWYNPKVRGSRNIGGDTACRRDKLLLTAESPEQLRQRHANDAARIRARRPEALTAVPEALTAVGGAGQGSAPGAMGAVPEVPAALNPLPGMPNVRLVVSLLKALRPVE